MFRDRTNLYISYRRTYPHHNRLDHESTTGFSRFDRLREEEEGLIRNGSDDELIDDGEGGIQLQTLPPNFLELFQEVEEILKFVRTKIDELNYLYKKNLLPGFNDNSIDMKKIDDLTFLIMKNFQKSYNMIKKIGELKYELRTKDEVVMSENVKKKLALETQTLSSKFRKLQNNYIKFLKDDEDYEMSFFKKSQGSGNGGSSQSLLLLQIEEEELEEAAEIESYSRELLKQSQSALLVESEQQQTNLQEMKQREEEISKIATGVIEISAIFRELESMIIDQGTMLDRIDYNLENVTVDLRRLEKDLVKSSSTQKRTQKCKLILLLSLVVFALFLMVMMRPKHVTVDHKYEGKPDSSSGDSSDSSNSGSGAEKNTGTDITSGSGTDQGDIVDSRPVVDSEGLDSVDII